MVAKNKFSHPLLALADSLLSKTEKWVEDQIKQKAAGKTPDNTIGSYSNFPMDARRVAKDLIDKIADSRAK